MSVVQFLTHFPLLEQCSKVPLLFIQHKENINELKKIIYFILSWIRKHDKRHFDIKNKSTFS